MSTDSIIARFQLDYGSFRLDADLSLPASGFSVFFGESGSGKTTLLRCMAGLERPSAGFFVVNNMIWQDSANKIFLPAHRRNLGYVFQEANLFPHLNIKQNLEFGLKRLATSQPSFLGAVVKSLHGQAHSNQPDNGHCEPHGESIRQNIATILELLGIGNLLDRLPDRLSGGERQRVAIARALVLSPDILLMDEPLASLDDKRKQEVLPYLLKLQQNLAIPIIYVTHSKQEVMQLADYLVVLASGKVQAAGQLTDMLSCLDSPLAQDKDAASVWQGKIASRDDNFKLAEVEFNGVRLSLPDLYQACGSRIRVQINARDVSVALEQPNCTSILNILPATITGLAGDKTGHTIVRLSCGGETLLAHITNKSAQLLNLQPGMAVFAQIKGTSLLI